MLRATLKSLLARKLRLTLSALAVILGVMFVSGAFVLTDTLGKSFDSLFASIYEGVSVQVDGKPRPGAPENGGPPVAEPIPASAVDQITAAPGVEKANGVVFANGARMIGKNNKVIVGQARFGQNWVDGGIVRLRSGHAPTADSEIVINQALADASGYKIGDQAGVLTRQPKKTFTIVGIFGYTGDRGSISGEQSIAFTTPVAQELLLGKTGVFNSVQVFAKSGISDATLKNNVTAAVGDAYAIKTGAELTKESANQTKKALGFVTNILLGFAGVALFVGTFLIINTFSIIVAQRTRELALMRAMGASGSQVIGSVLVEALVIGLIASIVGLGAGIGVGAGLKALMGGTLPDAGLSVPWTAVIAAFVVGLGVTMVAAVFPALRASRIPPIAAMREAANTTKPLTTITIVGGVVTAIGVVGLWLGLSGKVSGSGFWLVFGLGLILSFIGVALLTPMISRPIVSALGWLFSWSMPGKLGRGNSARNPRRTAITAAALMVGIALVTGVNVVLTSAKATISKAIDTGVSAELIVSGEQTGALPPTFDPAVLGKIKTTPGVRLVAGFYLDQVAVNDKPTVVAAVSDLPATAEIMSLKAKSGSLGPLTAGQLVIDTKTATDKHWALGDAVKIQGAQSDPANYTVVGIYDGTAVGFPGILAAESVAKAFTDPNPAQAYVKLADGANLGSVKNQIDTYLADSPEVNVSDRSSFVKQQTSILDTILNIIQILLTLAIVIAALGVLNTLSLSMIERTKELGLLRAIGMGRGQVMSMVTVESIVISVFGAVLGIAVGVGLGSAIVRALKDEGLDTLSLPWSQMTVYLVLAAVVGVIAGVIPAIRAARTNVLTAISYE